MKIPLKTRLALWWLRHRQKPTPHSNPLALRRHGRQVSSLLLFLPTNGDDLRVARIFLQSVSNAIGPQGTVKTYAVIKHTLLDTLQETLHTQFIPYFQEDVNGWGLPTEALVKRVLFRDFDALVDLNPRFNPLVAAITYRSDAPLRICFHTPLGEPYFNVTIEKKGTDFLEAGYEDIQQLLGLN